MYSCFPIEILYLFMYVIIQLTTVVICLFCLFVLADPGHLYLFLLFFQSCAKYKQQQQYKQKCTRQLVPYILVTPLLLLPFLVGCACVYVCVVLMRIAIIYT